MRMLRQSECRRLALLVPCSLSPGGADNCKLVQTRMRTSVEIHCQYHNYFNVCVMFLGTKTKGLVVVCS